MKGHLIYNDVMELYSLTFPNKKKYIGISVKASRRFLMHQRAARRNPGLPVHHALLKYSERVTLQVLCRGTPEYIKDLEIKAIALYHTQDRKFGYNVTAGGDFNRDGLKGTFLGRKHTPESIEKIKANSQTRGKVPPNRKLTDEQAKSIRQDTRILKEIALEYGVCIATISFIKSGRKYSTRNSTTIKGD